MGLNKPLYEWTHDDWVSNLNTNSWNYIGDWAYPKRENKGYDGVFYHYCGQRPRKFDGGCSPNRHELRTEKCGWCDTPVPDGIKMIVMLTEKL